MDFTNLIQMLMRGRGGQQQTPVDRTPYHDALLAWQKNRPKFNSEDWQSQFTTWQQSKPNQEDFGLGSSDNKGQGNPFLKALLNPIFNRR